MRETARQIDTWEFARTRGTLRGDALLQGFTRLTSGLAAQAERRVSWTLAGETDMLGRCFLVLQAQAMVQLECQRCLTLFDFRLKVENRLLLAESETEIEAEEDAGDDPDAPDRVLGSAHFDVLTLIEDELILALPYVPKHEVCPSLPDAMKSAEGSENVRQSPFSVLAQLKKD